MPYLNVDDSYTDHPKVDGLSDGAFRLHTAAMCHCAKYLTDGYVDESKVPRLVPRFRPTQVEELLHSHPERPLWIKVPDGYLLRDYLQWNKSRDWWELKRAADAKRQAEWRARREAQDDESQ